MNTDKGNEGKPPLGRVIVQLVNAGPGYAIEHGLQVETLNNTQLAILYTALRSLLRDVERRIDKRDLENPRKN